VASVRERAAGDLPSGVPFQPFLVEQDAHQLGDGDDRMGVVELDHDLRREVGPFLVAQLEATDDVTEAGGYEEVLLLQAQLLAARVAVVWVQDLRDGLGIHLLMNGARVVA